MAFVACTALCIARRFGCGSHGSAAVLTSILDPTMRKKSNGTRNSGQKERAATFGGHEMRAPLAGGAAGLHRSGGAAPATGQTEILDEDGQSCHAWHDPRRDACRQAHLRSRQPSFAGSRHVGFHRETEIRKSKSVSPLRATSLPAASRNPLRPPKNSAVPWSKSRPEPRRQLPLRRKRLPRPTARRQHSLKLATVPSRRVDGPMHCKNSLRTAQTKSAHGRITSN